MPLDLAKTRFNSVLLQRATSFAYSSKVEHAPCSDHQANVSIAHGSRPLLETVSTARQSTACLAALFQTSIDLT